MRTGPSKLMAEEVAHLLEDLGPIRITRFFAGAGLALDGVQFGFVMRAALYLRVNEATRVRYIDRGSEPFSYAGRAGPIVVASYYAAPAEIIEEPDELRNWAAEACAVARTERNASAPKLFKKSAAPPKRLSRN